MQTELQYTQTDLKRTEYTSDTAFPRKNSTQLIKPNSFFVINKKCKHSLKTYIKEMICIVWRVRYSGQCKEQCCQIVGSADSDMTCYPFCQYIQYLWQQII
jgi:hypothetical protein